MLGEFLDHLNRGVLIKDSNVFNVFSKNIEQIISFYGEYFRNESIDLATDLRKLFVGLLTYITYPQIVVAFLKILSIKYSDNKVCQFIGFSELQQIPVLLNNFRSDM